MISGQVWEFTWRDLMVVFGVVCLFGEVLKSTNTSSRAIVNHILSTLVFIVYLVEFIVVGFAAQSVFFILMVLALFDVLAGLTISIKAARRDLAVGHSRQRVTVNGPLTACRNSIRDRRAPACRILGASLRLAWAFWQARTRPRGGRVSA